MRLRPTREGKRFLLAVLVVGFAALNTGNNLMYLIFSMLFSVLFISVVLPYINLKALYVELDIKEPLYAKEQVTLRITIKNLKRLFPSYSVRLLLQGLLSEGIYIDALGPMEHREITTKVVFEKRGLYSLKDVELVTSFPFIFFTLTGPAGKGKNILIYPELMELKEDVVTQCRADTSFSGIRSTEAYEAGSIREYQRGDSLKSIHWKVTAKKGKLMVRELYEQIPQEFTIMLDNTPQTNKEHFEKAVSLAATLSWLFIKQGYPLRLITCGSSIPSGRGMEHLYRILDLLAVIKMEDSIDCHIEPPDQGALILILSSEGSALKRYYSKANRLYYASRL